MDGCTSAAHILNMKLTLMLRLQCLFTYSTPTHISHLAFSAALQRKNSHLCVIISPYPLKKDAPRILEEASSRCRPASRLRSTKREETNFHLTPPSPPYLLGWGEVQPTASVKSYKWFPGPKCHLLQTRRYKDAEALWYESALNSSHLPSDHHLRSNAGWGRHTLNVRYTDAQQIICVWRFSAFLCVWFFFFFWFVFSCLLFPGKALSTCSVEIITSDFSDSTMAERGRDRESRAPSSVWHQGENNSAAPRIPDVQLSQTAISWS